MEKLEEVGEMLRNVPFIMIGPLFPRLNCYASAVLLSVISASADAQTVNVNFDSAGDLSNFGQRTAGTVTGGQAPTTNVLAFGAAAGVNGSGGLTRTALSDVTATYLPAVFDLTSNAPFSISMFMKTGTLAVTGNGATLQLGFSASDTLALNGDSGNGFVSIRLLDVNNTDLNFQLQSQSKTLTGSTQVNTSSSFTLLSDEWYKLTGTISRTATAPTFSFSVSLEDWGPTGASFVSTVGGPFSTGTMANADLYTDTTLYAAFRQSSASAVAVDNFAVSVPEPGAFLSVIAGIGLLGLIRRRA